MTNNMSCKQAKAIDLVALLEVLGHFPVKIYNDDYWYLSPLRSERTASFKVNRRLNVWHDFGDASAGNLIDFGIRYFKCSVKDFLHQLLNMGSPGGLLVEQPARVRGSLIIPGSLAGEKKENITPRLSIQNAGLLHSPALFSYIQQRAIPHDLARNYCREVWYQLNNQSFYAVGFCNDAGGYELRSQHFKGSSSPKASTFINNNASAVDVFEGFFSFLSFLVVREASSLPPTNYLVLNSLAFFLKSRQLMEQHQEINLYLDRDKAGMDCTKNAVSISNRYRDRSGLYAGFKDCNHFLIEQRAATLQKTADLQAAKIISKNRDHGQDHTATNTRRRFR